MTKIVNGTIAVPAFNATGIPGEYQISGAVYNNQADLAGNGAYDIQQNFVIYVPASDSVNFMGIPGVVHRYKITSITVIDQVTVDLVVMWDEQGAEYDAPTNNSECLITETSVNKKYGYPVDPNLYPSLASYVSGAALNNDIQNITDRTQVMPGSTATHLHVQGVASATWTVSHNKGNTNYVYTIFDHLGEQCLPNEVETGDQNTIKLHFLAAMRGKAMFMFV